MAFFIRTWPMLKRSKPYSSLKPLLRALGAIASLGLCVYLLHHQGYGLSYQVSSSMPKGWYLQRPVVHLQRGDWIFVTPPTFARDYLQKNQWLPDSGVLLKSLQGMPGDWVCQKPQALWINQTIKATLLNRDINQQPIVKQPFCRRLNSHEYLVLGISDRRSYDGRYFGPIDRAKILGRALPLKL